MLAPVVIFVYNRYGHTIKTMEALSQNYLAKETEVFVYSDGAKNEKSKVEVDKVRQYMGGLENDHNFKTLKINYADQNRGLAKSVISGVSEVINKYGKVIVLEDDLISSPNLLNYMNEALDYYESKKMVWSICGYSYNLKIPKNYKHDVYFSYRAGSWGWGTWTDRWSSVDWEVADYDEFKADKRARMRFAKGGRDMPKMLDSQIQHKIDSWAIRFCYSQFKQQKLSVYPVKSKIRNTGLDGSGTHSGSTSKFDVDLDKGDTKEFAFISPKANWRIIRNFRNFITPFFKFYIIKFLKFIKVL